MFAVTSPEMGSVDTEVAPVIEWRTFDSTHTKYIVLVASEYTFDDKVILYSEELIDRGRRLFRKEFYYQWPPTM